MAEYHVKNGSHRAKAFKVKGGHVVVPAGKSDTIKDARELSEDQIDAFAKVGVKVTGKGAKAKDEKPDDSPAKSPAEVLAMFGDNEVPFMSAKAEATKLLGDNTPGKKAEIIAALEELATKPE